MERNLEIETQLMAGKVLVLTNLYSYHDDDKAGAFFLNACDISFPVDAPKWQIARTASHDLPQITLRLQQEEFVRDVANSKRQPTRLLQPISEQAANLREAIAKVYIGEQYRGPDYGPGTIGRSQAEVDVIRRLNVVGRHLLSTVHGLDR